MHTLQLELKLNRVIYQITQEENNFCCKRQGGLIRKNVKRKTDYWNNMPVKTYMQQLSEE